MEYCRPRFSYDYPPLNVAKPGLMRRIMHAPDTRVWNSGATITSTLVICTSTLEFDTRLQMLTLVSLNAQVLIELQSIT